MIINKKTLAICNKICDKCPTAYYNIFLLLCILLTFECRSLECPLLNDNEFRLPPTHNMIAQCINQSSTFLQAVARLNNIIPTQLYHSDNDDKEYSSREELIAKNVMKSLSPKQALWNIRRLNLLEKNPDTMNSEERCVYIAILLRSMRLSAKSPFICLVSCGSHIPDAQKRQILVKACGSWNTVVKGFQNLENRIINIFDQDTQDYIKMVSRTGTTNSCCGI